ncbi:MAG: type II toxin-antitoxin system RelE/ParE family toxin [Candidatus Omnitrophica bacterium]|nr:type II toxin-antitoxin system RelE/ParE family toxin [Candidatus Omnitrophota bacterium]
MRPLTEDYIFYCGNKIEVEFYFTEEGEIPAKEFLESINEAKLIGKLMGYAKLIAEQGTLYDEKKFRIVAKKQRMYEFKPMAFRFFSFFSGGKLIITNGYMKKSQKVKREELNRAIRYKNDYLFRVERGEYYEEA